MKKLILSFFSLLFLASLSSIYAQEELFENPGFEIWNSGGLGDEATGWEIALGKTFKESTVVKSGTYAARLQGSTFTKLNQEVYAQFVQGDVYELSINYYVSQSQGSNDIQLNCYWDGIDVEDPEAEKLIENFTGSASWQNKTIQTAVPKNATKFYFVLKMPAGAEVVFDDLSFKKTDLTVPYINISTTSIPKVSTTVNTPVNMQKITISSGNLPNPASIEITGKDRVYFTPSVTSIPTDKRTTELIITYNPTVAASEHTATLLIDCRGAESLSKTISLKGGATDPSAVPVITVNTSALTFNCEVEKQEEKTVLISSENMTDWVYARVMGEGEGSFVINTSMLPKNTTDTPLKITFKPKKSGTFNERIELSSAGAETKYVQLTGTATGSGTDPEKEGDEYPLDPSNPQVLLNEKFDNIIHNKPLSINGWKNIAEKNYRAWWGYDFNLFKGTDEKTAKVTAFNSTNTAANPYEMWLITPPLDFKNSASKMFTFRVMGELITEASDAVLELYYMDLEENDLYKQKIEMPMPSIPDQNNEWMEFHLNLEGQNLADVFFMGFRFAATGGLENSVVYYIDDVTYGRTDIPVITPSVTTLELRTKPDIPVVSESITITTNNLAEPVTISVGGANPSKFEPSIQTLPVTGGSFTVTFTSDLLGVHEAYIKLSSRGAADVYIFMAAISSNDTGISTEKINPVVWSDAGNIMISAGEDLKAALYTISGVKVCEYNHTGGISKFPVNTGKGVYIVQLKKADSTVNIKIAVE